MRLAMLPAEPVAVKHCSARISWRHCRSESRARFCVPRGVRGKSQMMDSDMIISMHITHRKLAPVSFNSSGEIMLSKKVAINLLLILCVVFLSAFKGEAQVLVSAKILSSDGPVEIQRRSQGQAALVKVAYSVNDALLAGDVIKTLKGGRLVLGLSDGSQAIISEKTTIEITDLSQTPRTLFNVLRGKTRIRIEKVGGRPNPYKVNTPTAVIAVRGTLFDLLVTEKETQVFVHEGRVAVSNPTTPDVFVLLSPEQRTRVQRAAPPESPTPFHPGRNDDSFRPPPGRDTHSERNASATQPHASGHDDTHRDDSHRPADSFPRDSHEPAPDQHGGDAGHGASPSGNPSPGGPRGGGGGGGRPPEELFPVID
jgi:hypothetical protein